MHKLELCELLKVDNFHMKRQSPNAMLATGQFYIKLASVANVSAFVMGNVNIDEERLLKSLYRQTC